MFAALPPPPPPEPVVHLDAPLFASDRSRGRGVRLRWTGVGAARYTLEVRRNSNVGTRWRTVVGSTTRRSAVFPGRLGLTYLFRLRARDAVGRLSEYAYGLTTVPRDDRSEFLSFGPGWRRVEQKRAWGGSITRATRRGREAGVVFGGSRVALIARRTPRGATLLVTVDDRRKLVRLRGRDRFRRVVFRSIEMDPGMHRLHVETATRGVADLDAVAVEKGPSAPD
jgi:hypothetical protein